jgi:excisionase family DNA binding protein
MKLKEQAPEHPAIEQARCLRVEQFAQLKNVSVWTVRNWIDAGLIPATKIAKTVLIPLQSAEKALAQLTVGGAAQ